MRRRLFALSLGLLTLILAPVSLARYSVCWSIYDNDCLNYQTCFHFDDEGNQSGIVYITYECP